MGDDLSLLVKSFLKRICLWSINAGIYVLLTTENALNVA